MPKHSTPTVPVLHPYVRISDPVQRKGGGLERQTTANIAEFCRLYGFAASKRLWVDDGVSAFNGLNASPDHELGRFMAEAKRGLIRPGDCLLLENWDRLSRQNIWAAIGLVNDLRQLGIHVGRLDRMKLLRCDSADPGDFFEAAVELMRGHSESAAKSMRNGAAWKRKRERARATQIAMTRRGPAWLRPIDVGETPEGKTIYKFETIPERAAAVKRIFELRSAGYGYVKIVQKLIAEEVPAFGEPVVKPGRKRSAFAGEWTVPYVVRILGDRRAVGEMQPCGKGRKPEGKPIAGFYPVVVTEEEFWAAKAAHPKHERRPTRIGKHSNLFAGLLRNARDGDTYQAQTKGLRYLVTGKSMEGKGPTCSFPLAVFEDAVLSCLKEIDPHEILNGDHEPDQTTALTGELARVDAELAEATAYMNANGFSATIGKRVTTLEDRQRELAQMIALARQTAAYPLSESWGEAQTLAALLKTAADPDDVRLRLRGAIRRIVSEVWVLVVARGLTRLCAVQMWFAGEKKHREYLIVYHAATKCRKGGWMLAPRVLQGKNADLRNREHARALEKALLATAPPPLPTAPPDA